MDDVKDVASRRFPGKTIWGVVEAVIPEDPHRYLFWLEQGGEHLRIAGVERLTLAGQAGRYRGSAMNVTPRSLENLSSHQ